MFLSGKMPLSIQIKYFSKNTSTILTDHANRDYNTTAIKNAACILFITPMLIFYMIVQRWFIESIDRVGITG